MSRDDIYLELFGMVFRHQAYILTVISSFMRDSDGKRVRETADWWMKLADVCSTKEDSK